MMNFLSAYTAQSYALMRIVAGFLFLWHGSQKLLGFPP
ncbi:MAG: LuxR family transcriptional regulator, partial [Deltaproteobacteria bacterium]|nr:LuxR family transcriptional regulator [Deltaproteobacteria bacterium]